MYGEGKGGDIAGPLAVVNGAVILPNTGSHIVNGAVILPNTGGSKFLVGFAIVSIVVGVAIIASTILRIAVKKAHKA